MNMIKELDIREVVSLNGNKKRYRYALFSCNVCGNKVERKKFDGIKQKKCCGGKSKIASKGEPLHTMFCGIRQRCSDAKAINYKNYGGRGIKLCKEWHNFDNFAKYALLNGYVVGLEIDRIDNDGNYEPNNIRFVSKTENSRKTRRSIHTHEDIRNIKKEYVTTLDTMADLAVKYNDSAGNIANIISGRIWSDIDTEYDRYIESVSKAKELIKGDILKIWKKHYSETPRTEISIKPVQ